MSMHLYLRNCVCSCVSCFVCVCVSFFFWWKGLWRQLRFLGRSKPSKRDRLYCLLCVSRTTTGGETEGSEGWGDTGYVCLRKGVCVRVCPEDVLLLMQRPNIEKNTHPFYVLCCMCGVFELTCYAMAFCSYWKGSYKIW